VIALLNSRSGEAEVLGGKEDKMKRTLLPILVIGILLLSACGTPSTVPAAEEEEAAPLEEEEVAPPEEEAAPQPVLTECSGVTRVWSQTGVTLVLCIFNEGGDGNVTLDVDIKEGGKILLSGTRVFHMDKGDEARVNVTLDSGKYGDVYISGGGSYGVEGKARAATPGDKNSGWSSLIAINIIPRPPEVEVGLGMPISSGGITWTVSDYRIAKGYEYVEVVVLRLHGKYEVFAAKEYKSAGAPVGKEYLVVDFEIVNGSETDSIIPFRNGGHYYLLLREDSKVDPRRGVGWSAEEIVFESGIKVKVLLPEPVDYFVLYIEPNEEAKGHLVFLINEGQSLGEASVFIKIYAAYKILYGKWALIP